MQEIEDEMAEDGEAEVEGGEGDANVDDIPIEGEDDGGVAVDEEEEKEVVDKLRPKVKAYGEPVRHLNKEQFYRGLS